jgi:hypothetical protein
MSHNIKLNMMEVIFDEFHKNLESRVKNIIQNILSEEDYKIYDELLVKNNLDNIHDFLIKKVGLISFAVSEMIIEKNSLEVEIIFDIFINDTKIEDIN